MSDESQKLYRDLLKRRHFAPFSRRLSVTQSEIGRLEDDLRTIEGQVSHLQTELAERSQAVAKLEFHKAATEKSLETAKTLLHKLDIEHRDWEEQFGELKKRKERLALDAADVASFLVYQVTFWLTHLL